MSGRSKLKITIRQFKNKTSMGQDYADNTWELLKKAITEIHKKNASKLSFEELYRNAYNMVLHKHGDRLYRGLTQVVEDHLKGSQEAVATAHDTLFLETLDKHWNDHKVSMLMIRDILMYMDRVYVTQENVLAVFELGLTKFKETVVYHPSIRPRLKAQLLGAIHKERNNELVDHSLLKSMTTMLVDLGLGTRDVYRAELEKDFLQASSDFYREESNIFITSNNCADFMEKVEQRLYEESLRVLSYLDHETESEINRVLEREMIENHLTTLIKMESGLVSMLKDLKIDDLRRMYDLFNRVPTGPDEMRAEMSTYLRETGKAIAEIENIKPVEYIRQVIELKDRYDRVLEEAFQSDPKFTQTVHLAFEHFVNQNRHAPEYLSLFIDEKLRRGTKSMSEDEVELLLDKAMAIFRFLSEKDVFEKYYKQHLAKRLLMGRSISDDAESNMISRLKKDCGFQYTSKFESMFTDIRISHDHMENFSNFIGSEGIDTPLDIKVTILTKGVWPTTELEVQCILPSEMQMVCDTYESFYKSIHSGRILEWQTNMGTVDIKARFKKGYDLNCSTFQAAILLLFNSNESLSFDHIGKMANISERDLKRALTPMFLGRTKLLKKEPEGKTIGEDDIFIVNEGFRSKDHKLRILTGSGGKKNRQAEQKEVRQQVDEDRKHEVEAAVVRVMKSRKTLEHNNLIAEVTRLLMKRFKVTPNQIKRRIESLIEREYLDRTKEDRKVYHYLA